MLIIIKELYDLAACMFLNHLVMHAAGPFLPGHSAFCLRCFIMYMFHGVSGRGRHLENVLPVTAWKNGWYGSGGFDFPC